MRIALVHHSVPPVVGGVERVVAQQAVVLADAGHMVTVVAARGDAPDPRVGLCRLPLADSLHPEILGLQADLDAGRVPGSFVAMRDRLVAGLSAALAGSDVVLCHNVCSLNKNLALTAALRELADRPAMPRLVLWHHDLAWTQPRYQASLHDGYPWDLLRTAWPDVLQVAISEARRRELSVLTGLDPQAIRVIPNGVDIRALLKMEPETVLLPGWADILRSDPLLLMPVRVLPRKNIELGLRVVAAMRSGGRRAGLLVSGPADPHDGEQGGYLRKVLRLRSALGLEDGAWLPGLGTESGLPEGMVADLFAVADALFLPSRDEGFGIPVLEAGLRRLPIVCSDLPSLREVAGDAALYLGTDDDPGAVARRVLDRLDADPVARHAVRTRRECSWEAIYGQSIVPLLESATELAAGPHEAPSKDACSRAGRSSHRPRSLR